MVEWGDQAWWNSKTFVLHTQKKQASKLLRFVMMSTKYVCKGSIWLVFNFFQSQQRYLGPYFTHVVLMENCQCDFTFKPAVYYEIQITIFSALRGICLFLLSTKTMTTIFWQWKII